MFRSKQLILQLCGAPSYLACTSLMCDCSCCSFHCFFGSLSQDFKDASVLVEAMILPLKNIGTVQDPRHGEIYSSGLSQNYPLSYSAPFVPSIFSPEHIILANPSFARHSMYSFDLLGTHRLNIKLLPYIFPTTI